MSTASPSSAPQAPASSHGLEAYHLHLMEAAKLAAQLTQHQKNALETIANQMARPGRGLLAADESVPTLGKRLVAAGLVNDEETRRAYREVLFSHPDLGEYLSGAILFSETLGQKAVKDAEGRLFPALLQSKGVLPGVKVDLGLEPLEYSARETHTKGMNDLMERCQEFYAQGARFAKWRAVIRIDEAANLPTRACMQINSAELARYAATCQACGLVPIVEPEILIEGAHSAETFARVTEAALSEVYYTLAQAKVFLEGTLLKPQMIMPGVDSPSEGRPRPEEAARRTLEALRRRVPPAVPGVVFLSGGQTEEQATQNLNLINQLAKRPASPFRPSSTTCPWILSFSFGRSLQASVLATWDGKDKNYEKAMEVAGALAKANAQAQLGEYQGPHPSVLKGQSLHETNRGWGANAGEGGGKGESTAGATATVPPSGETAA
ncbi:fructose- -bisphosphate [Nannochloropsis gaditana]|nr:fructose- -bisphosphate [Nannochloropsis gaditana]